MNILLEQIDKLHNGYSKRFSIAGEDCLLVHSGGRTYLIGSICPHGGASLANGDLGEGAIRCRKHGIAFDLCSGRPLGGPVTAMVPSLTCHPIHIEDGEIYALMEGACEDNHDC